MYYSIFLINIYYRTAFLFPKTAPGLIIFIINVVIQQKKSLTG